MENMRIIRQRRIDDGQIGGFLSIFTQSMFIFSIVNFLGISALVYQSILKFYVPIWTFFILMITGYFGWMAIYYSVLMPSMIRFGNRQNYAHGNPIRNDIDSLKDDLRNIKEELKDDFREIKEELQELKSMKMI